MLSRRVLIAGMMLTCAPAAFAEEQAFEVGQVWTLRAPMERTARIRVGRIEDSGATIHVSLWDVRPPVPNRSGALQDPIWASHLPISSAALLRSVDQLAQDSPPEHFDLEPGYQHWRQANGGVFTITVAEIVNVILQTAPGDGAVHE